MMSRSLREFALDRMLAVRLAETDDPSSEDGDARAEPAVTDWVAPKLPAGF
jgi:hypothetical protein